MNQEVVLIHPSSLILHPSLRSCRMHALTPDDLLPLDEYAGRRREFFEAQCRYVDRYRRVRIGPRATLLFENRQTLWFRVQEVLRIARLADPALVRRELDLQPAASRAERSASRSAHR